MCCFSDLIVVVVVCWGFVVVFLFGLCFFLFSFRFVGGFGFFWVCFVSFSPDTFNISLMLFLLIPMGTEH